MKLFNMLPNMYKEDDLSHTLENFLDVMQSELDSQRLTTKNLSYLIDVDKCPSEFLPHLMRNFGIEYESDIPERFQRKFLKNIVSLFKKKGTPSCLTYLARELSGFTCAVSKDPTLADTYRVTIVGIQENDPALITAQGVIQRYLTKYFTPVGTTVLVVTDYQYSDKGLPYSSPIDTDLGTKISCIYDYIKEYGSSSTEAVENKVTLLQVETNQLPSYKSSVANKGLLNSNFYANIINGIDTITTNETSYSLVY